MGSFLRATITDDNFIRGAARILIADVNQPFPTEIDDIIQLAATATDEVQTLTITGTPTGGTFRLGFRGAVSGEIQYNAAPGDVQSALEAMPTIGVGNVAAAGSALPGGSVSITFAGQLAGQNVDTLTVENNSLTGGTTPAPTVVVTTPGQGQYDPQDGWQDLGATKTGVQIVRNNAEETFDVDQIMGDIASEPTNWEMNVGTSLAEMTLDMLDIAWEGGSLSAAVASTGVEKSLGLGLPTQYTRRRLAVLHQRANGKIRAYVFRLVQRLPQESTITHAKTGEQVSIPVRFRCLADSSVSDERARFGVIYDQV